jgi:hypothetical protein
MFRSSRTCTWWASVIFRYARRSASILRPIIPVDLEHDGFVVPYEVLVDSGADINVFAYQIGELLGLDLRSGEGGEAIGITGEPAELYIHPITLNVDGRAHNIRAAFSRALDDMPYGVVGQYGFFDLFEVRFNLPAEEIELTAHGG